MKILKNIFLFFFIVICLAGIGVFIFLKTLDVNKFKPRIVEELKKVLGREVELGDIGLQLTMKPGIAVEIKYLQIAEDSQFGKESFVRIKAIKCDVDLQAYLKTKVINVTSISIESPQINLIRNESGLFNYQGIIDHMAASQVSPQVPAQPAVPAKPQTPESVSSIIGDPVLVVKTIELLDGNIHYQDKMPATAMNFSVNNIDLNVKNFSLNQPFIIEAALSVFSAEQNIQGNGEILLDLSHQSVLMKRLSFKSDLAWLSPVFLKQGIAALAPVNFDGGLKGQIVASIDELKAGNAGVTKLKLNVQLTKGEMKLKEIFSPFTQVTANVDADERDLMVKDASVEFASGKISVEGRLDDYLKTQKPSFRIDMDQIQLMQVVDQASFPAKVEGKVSVQLSAQAEGLAPEQLKSSLTGNGKFALLEGRIKDMNILKSVLDKMTALPAVGGVYTGEEIINRLPESYRDRLKIKDTIIDHCQTGLQFVNGAARFNDFNIQTSGIRVGLNGQIDLDQNIELDGQAALDQELSSSIVSSQETFSWLLNENKEIAIPLTSYKGKLAQLKIFPDFKDFVKNALVNKGKQELRNVIFKALDLEPKPQVQPAQVQSPPAADKSSISSEGQSDVQAPEVQKGEPASTTQPELSPEQKAIEQLLNQIPLFGGK